MRPTECTPLVRSTAQRSTARRSVSAASRLVASQRIGLFARVDQQAGVGRRQCAALEGLWLCFRAAEWVWLQTPRADGYGWPTAVAVLCRFARSGIGLAGRRPESVVALHEVRPVHGVRVFRLFAPPTLRGLDLQHTTCAGSS